MAGRRSLAKRVLWRRSMGWWWCLIVLGIGGCRGVLAADSPAMEPSAAVACGEEGGCTCYRPLSNVIWGFLVTLLALTASFWNAFKHNAILSPMRYSILLGLLAPLLDLGLIIEKSVRCVSLLWKFHKTESPDSRMTSFSWLKFLCSSMFPWSKSPVRILVNCDIVVYVSKESPLLQKKGLRTKRNVIDESEAMVIGENGARATRDHQFEKMQLSDEGIDLLVWREVFFKAKEPKRLPKYDELKYLRGNSGFATIAIAMQALGYIYAVGFRVAMNLRLSPLEVLGFVFNVILLMKVFCYRTCNRCHRPLVIYMDKEWEDDFVKGIDIESKKLKVHPSKSILVVIYFGIFVILTSMLIYFIVKMAKAANVVVTLPIIVFSFGHCLEIFGTSFFLGEISYNLTVYIRTIAYTVNAVVYIWATIGTVLYWRTMQFNVQGELINLSEIIPFIG